MKPLSELLSSADLDVIRDCLRAAVDGPFFPDWEFATIMSVERHEMRKVLETWPQQTVDDDTFVCATIHALNNLLGYPHRMKKEVVAYVPAGLVAILHTLRRLDAAIGKPIGKPKRGYVDFLVRE